jgi:membrane protein
MMALLFGASQVFVELQAALNRIWDAEMVTRRGVIGLISRRFFSFGLVLARR